MRAGGRIHQGLGALTAGHNGIEIQPVLHQYDVIPIDQRALQKFFRILEEGVRFFCPAVINAQGGFPWGGAFRVRKGHFPVYDIGIAERQDHIGDPIRRGNQLLPFAGLQVKTAQRRSTLIRRNAVCGFVQTAQQGVLAQKSHRGEDLPFRILRQVDFFDVEYVFRGSAIPVKIIWQFRTFLLRRCRGREFRAVRERTFFAGGLLSSGAGAQADAKGTEERDKTFPQTKYPSYKREHVFFS